MATPYPIVILAGGLATRLRPVTATIPKSLIMVNEEPFIYHQLRLLKGHGIKDVIMCVGYLGEMIEQTIGDGSQFGLHIRYVYDGEKLLGTAGAIKRAAHFLTTPFFVLYGDSYLDCDYLKIQAAFDLYQCQGLMTVYHNQGQWDNSNVEYADGKIIKYDKEHRTKQMQYIDYGLGIFSNEVLAQIPADTSYDLALVYQSLLNEQQLAGFEVNKRFYEVGSFAGIQDLAYYLLRKTNENKVLG